MVHEYAYYFMNIFGKRSTGDCNHSGFWRGAAAPGG